VQNVCTRVLRRDVGAVRVVVVLFIPRVMHSNEAVVEDGPDGAAEVRNSPGDPEEGVAGREDLAAEAGRPREKPPVGTIQRRECEEFEAFVKGLLSTQDAGGAAGILRLGKHMA